MCSVPNLYKRRRSSIECCARAARLGGTEMIRDTLGHSARAGFTVTGVWSVFLDLVRP